MKNRSRFIPLAIYMMVLLAAFTWLGDIFGSDGNTVTYSEVVSLFRQEQVKAFEIQDEVITMELYGSLDGENVVQAKLAYPEHFHIAC